MRRLPEHSAEAVLRALAGHELDANEAFEAHLRYGMDEAVRQMWNTVQPALDHRRPFAIWTIEPTQPEEPDLTDEVVRGVTFMVLADIVAGDYLTPPDQGGDWRICVGGVTA